MAVYGVQALFSFSVEANSAKEAREIVANCRIKQGIPFIDGEAQEIEMEMERWDEKTKDWIAINYWEE